MFRVFTVLLVVLGSFNAFSFEHLSLDGQFRTKDVVKMKLWYEGIEVKTAQNQVDSSVDLPEELLVPLSKFKF